MVKKTIPQQLDGTGIPRRDTLVAFSQDDITYQGKISELTAGLSVVYVSSADDFPTPVGGVITLEQDTGYVILNPIVLSDRIRFPAAWSGFIRSTNQLKNTIVFVGTGSLFSTEINANSIITSIADAGGGAITITTSIAHFINNGDLINIIADTEPTYSQRKVIVSNVTATTFDVQIPFVATDTGKTDAGVVSAIFDDLFCIHAVPGTTDNLFEVQATVDPLSIFVAERVFGLNFNIAFVISHFQTAVTNFCSVTFRSHGILLDDCVDSSVNTCKLTAEATSIGIAKAIEIFGGDTRDVVIFNTKLNLAINTQHAVKIDNTVNAADVNITTTPDNQVNNDYFDPAGLTQKDKQIITLNNGVRQDSEDLAEVMSDVILVVPDAEGTAIRIEQSPPVTNDFILDSTTEGFTLDNATGVITYNGRKPKRVRIEYSLEAQKIGGGSENLDIELHVNNIAQPKTIRSIISGSAFLPISYLGGYFMINPSETIELFKNNNGSDHNIQKMVILVR